MKNLHLIVLAAVSLVMAAMVLAACDRSMDKIGPPSISDGNYGPATVYPSLMINLGGPPVPEEEEDITTGEKDTVVEDIGAADTEFEVNECIGSGTFCDCMAEKGYDGPDYTGYCECMDAPTHPVDHLTYCSCCYFAYDSNFPEFGEWQYLVAGTCEPQGIFPPSCMSY